MTALQYAPMGGNLAIVEAILAAGADVNSKDEARRGLYIWRALTRVNSGWLGWAQVENTALHYAAECRYVGSFRMAGVLLAARADVNAKGKVRWQCSVACARVEPFCDVPRCRTRRLRSI
jgi:ankyrin repeat protein